MINIYVLLTSRVPFPRETMLFAIVGLAVYSLLLGWQVELNDIGMPHPAALALLSAFLVNLARNLPHEFLDRKDIGWKVGTLLVLTLGLCAIFLFAPKLVWIQHLYSAIALLNLGSFLLLYNSAEGPNAFSWIGRNWHRGQRNAANWVVASRVATILINESLIRHGTPTDWLVGIMLANIALHYLIYWTILATHPYEESEPDQRP